MFGEGKWFVYNRSDRNGPYTEQGFFWWWSWVIYPKYLKTKHLVCWPLQATLKWIVQQKNELYFSSSTCPTVPHVLPVHELFGTCVVLTFSQYTMPCAMTTSPIPIILSRYILNIIATFGTIVWGLFSQTYQLLGKFTMVSHSIWL